MLEGDEWKNGDKPMATGKDMFGHMKTQARLLLDVQDFDRIVEVRVTEVSPDGDYVCLYQSGFMGGGFWVRTSDCQVLCVFPRKQTIEDLAVEDTKRAVKEMLGRHFEFTKEEETWKDEEDEDNE